MKGYNLGVSNKSVDSWNDRKIFIGGVSFVVSMETIILVMVLLVVGIEMSFNSHGHYKPYIK